MKTTIKAEGNSSKKLGEAAAKAAKNLINKIVNNPARALELAADLSTTNLREILKQKQQQLLLS